MLLLFSFHVVRRMSRKFGMKEVGEDEDWTLYWTDWTVPLERVIDMKKYQVWSRDKYIHLNNLTV